MVLSVWGKGDAFLFGAGAPSQSEPFTRLPPQHKPQIARRCHPSHNPYDPPFDAHGGGHAPSRTLSPGQHPTAHHNTTSRPVFPSERRFVPVPLFSRRPALLTTDKLRIFLASSSGPETPERRVGGDLVCGHVRNLCGGHGCVILQARHQVRVFTRSRVVFRADAFRAPSASSRGLWSKQRSGWRLGARPLTTSQNLRVAGHLSLAISNAFFPHRSI